MIEMLQRTKGKGSLVLAMLLAVAGCGGPTAETPPEVTRAQAEFADALEDLQLGAYDAASLRLLSLLEDEDLVAVLEQHDRNLLDQIRFGYVVAGTLNQINVWTQTLGIILGTIGSMGSFGIAPGIFEPLGGSGLIAPALTGYLQQFYDFFDGMHQILEEIKGNPGFRLKLTQLPIRICCVAGESLELADAGGEYDVAEVYLIDSGFQFIMGVLKALIAIDFEVNFNNTVNYIIDRIPDLADDPVNVGLNLVAVLLHGQPKFLGLAEKGDMQLAGTLFADSMSDFVKALDSMRAETDDQDDDVIGYYRGQGGASDKLVFHVKLAPSPIPGVDTTKLGDLEVELSDEIFTSLDNIDAAFSGTPGARISWSRDLVPLISLTVVTVIRSGAFDGLIQAALESGNLPPDQVAAFQNILNSDLLTTDLVAGLLRGLIPDVFEFDVYAYFNDPVGPRQFLPYWTNPVTQAVTETTSNGEVKTSIVERLETITFLFEYECATANTVGKFPSSSTGTTEYLCPSNDIQDMAHFTTAPVTDPTFEAYWAARNNDLSSLRRFDATLDTPGSKLGLPADGRNSPLPYLALQDPTLGGMLYISLGPVVNNTDQQILDYYGSRDVNGFYLADNFTLNALLASLIEGLAELL